MARSLIGNIKWLYMVHALNVLLPLLAFPYLARVLGPASWGRVLVAHTVAAYIVVIVEYGFSISGTREAARCQNDPVRCGQLLSGVLGAQLILFLAAATTAQIASTRIPALAGDWRLRMAAGVFALGASMNLGWFFQGIEDLKGASSVEAASRAAGLLAVFAAVRSVPDAYLALLLPGLASVVGGFVNIGLASRNGSLCRPTVALIRDALRLGRNLFAYKSTVTLYTTANALILGIFAPPESVAFFSAADKVCRGLTTLTGPVQQAIFPRIAYLTRRQPGSSSRLALPATLAMTAVAGAAGALTFLFAPHIVRQALGEKFGPVTEVLRILSVVPVLITLSTALGMFWLLPSGHDRDLNCITLAAGILNISLAVPLATSIGHTGVAIAVVVTHVVTTSALFLVVRWRQSESRKPTLMAAAGADLS